MELIQNSEERTTYFIDNGGLDYILEVIEVHRSDSFLVFTYTGLVIAMFENMNEEQRASIGPRAFEIILPTMELHKTMASHFVL